MLNTKETLKKLHNKFPLMSLDELFEILDCYTEESMFTYPYTNPIKTDPPSFPWTITCEKQHGSNQNVTYLKSDITTANNQDISGLARY